MATEKLGATVAAVASIANLTSSWPLSLVLHPFECAVAVANVTASMLRTAPLQSTSRKTQQKREQRALQVQYHGDPAQYKAALQRRHEARLEATRERKRLKHAQQMQKYRRRRAAEAAIDSHSVEEHTKRGMPSEVQSSFAAFDEGAEQSELSVTAAAAVFCPDVRLFVGHNILSTAPCDLDTLVPHPVMLLHCSQLIPQPFPVMEYLECCSESVAAAAVASEIPVEDTGTCADNCHRGSHAAHLSDGDTALICQNPSTPRRATENRKRRAIAEPFLSFVFHDSAADVGDSDERST
jgi:hypothetical protein